MTSPRTKKMSSKSLAPINLAAASNLSQGTSLDLNVSLKKYFIHR